MRVKDITNSLEEWAPLSYQESYDNSGLLVGNASGQVKKILVTLDTTEKVLDEAIGKKVDMIVMHHPIIFGGLKKITEDHWVSRCITKAIKNDIALYAIHTNLDNVATGVNHKIAEKLKLQKTQILAPKNNTLTKLVTFIPEENTQEVLDGLYKVGAGEIGQYDHCSFRVTGTGTFRPGDEALPHIGKKGQDESVIESRVELIFPSHLQREIINQLREVHPYDEVAYYLTALDNVNQEVGSGMIGYLNEKMDHDSFINYLKEHMGLGTIRHTSPIDRDIQKIAVCGGSGSFLLGAARRQNADVLITGDFKYHDFFEADHDLLIADIGHYESEVFTKDLLHDFLKKKFANIAVLLSEVNTNPIIYS